MDNKRMFPGQNPFGRLTTNCASMLGCAAEKVKLDWKNGTLRIKGIHLKFEQYKQVRDQLEEHLGKRTIAFHIDTGEHVEGWDCIFTWEPPKDVLAMNNKSQPRMMIGHLSLFISDDESRSAE